MQSTSPTTSLQEEQQVMTLLLELLKQEQSHLVSADIDSLTEVTAQKTALVGRMAGLASVRHSALGAAGFAAQESGMQAWMEASGNGADIKLWQQVLALTREAKEINRVNGMLINKHMAHSQGALNALRPNAQGGDVYGPSGHASKAPANRRFVIG
jgi:flagella synthesis protein FlgN